MPAQRAARSTCLFFAVAAATATAVAFPASDSKEQSQSSVTVITDVTVIRPGSDRPRQEHMTVVIRGDAIAAVGPASATPVPDGASEINAEGKFLAPGLIDLHVHLSKTRASAMLLFVANGVTTVRDMGGDFEELAEWRRQVRSGSRIGPDIVMAGPYLESARNIERMRKDPPAARIEPFERTRIPIGSPAEARRIVASLAGSEVDFIKIRTVEDLETYAALNEAANAQGIPLVGHVDGIPPQAVLQAGQDGIEHWIYPSPDGAPERAALWKQFAERGVPIVPTIGVLFESTFPAIERLRAIVGDDAGLIEPRRKYLSKFLALDWREQVSEATQRRQDALRRIWETTIRRDLREMHAAGMDILVGTDTAVLNLYPGFSIHEELFLFVRELGMTPAEALDRATRRSAAFLRLEHSVGTVDRGKVANLLLLDADPLVDIRNTTRIAAVVSRGRVYTRNAIEGLKNQVLTSADVKADDWGRTRQ